MPGILKSIGRIRRNDALNPNSENDKYRARADELGEQTRRAPEHMYTVDENGHRYITKEASDYMKDAKRKLANHEWYVHNKSVKQKYNKEYYQKNREYWQKRYLDALKEYNRLDKQNDHAINERVASQLKGDIGGAKSMAELQRLTEWHMGKVTPELNAAKTNYLRSIREEQDFINSHKRMPITDAWKLGASSIVDAGRDFISKLIGK